MSDQVKGEPVFVLRRSAAEVWHLRESYEASFTDPDAKNEINRRLSDKLDELQQKAYATRRRSLESASESIR